MEGYTPITTTPEQALYDALMVVIKQVLDDKLSDDLFTERIVDAVVESSGFESACQSAVSGMDVSVSLEYADFSARID